MPSSPKFTSATETIDFSPNKNKHFVIVTERQYMFQQLTYCKTCLLELVRDLYLKTRDTLLLTISAIKNIAI